MTGTAACGILFFGVYVIAMAALERRATTGSGGSVAAFAAGRAAHRPWPTALVIAACLTSTASFAINPGFVYREGLAALVAFSVPVAAGVALALALLGPPFRESSLGPDGEPRLLTLSQWIGARFASERLCTLYAVLLLSLFAYVVLIVVGAAYVVRSMLGVPFAVAGVIVVALALVDTLRGGAGAHAAVNAAQGAIMAGAGAILGGVAAWRLLADGSGALSRVGEADPALLALVRPGSALFGSAADVLLFPLAIGFALGCQPHVLGKMLLVRERAAVVRAAAASGALFLAISLCALGVGLAARADLGPGLPQDSVASSWIAGTLPAPVAALVQVALLAAALSTLEGLLLALGTTLSFDVLGRRTLGGARGATAVMGVAAALVAASPPALVWVTGALGACAFVAATCPAVVAGALEGRRAAPGWIAAAALLGAGTHIALYAAGASPNPNATGAAGLLVGLSVAGAGTFRARAAARLAGRAPVPALSPNG